jgi:phage shock protein B
VEEVIIPVMVIGMLFIGLPWIILHYITRWKTAATLTTADENLMEDLYDLARRLEDRMGTVERILTAENPNWRSLASDPYAERLEPPLERPARPAERFDHPAERAAARTVSNAPGRLER